MKKLWLTYAWKDNEDKDIDYIIQELDKTDISVKFDRRNLIPGQRLWTQIGGFITDPNECDAWGIVLTRNSLESDACIEELSYALDRALDSKGEKFPLFALLHNISSKMLPPALKIRLCINLEDTDWVSQVLAAVKQSALGYTPSDLSPYILKEHPTDNGYWLEIRPRFERISPFMVAVDYVEKSSRNVTRCIAGSAGVPALGTMWSWIDSDGTLTDGTHIWFWQGGNEASSIYSYYLFYKKRPKRIWVGRPENLERIIL